MTAMIACRQVGKSYDGKPAVENLSLDVEEGALAVIVGTSGSGKSTLLRMINRLIEPTSGDIFIEGRNIRDTQAHVLRRSIGYVIQGNGLFPHRSVASNIATVPQLLGWDRKRIAARTDALLETLQLDPVHFRDKYPHELSGGEQQRVGIARALAAGPPVLLMDEPFGALDPLIRAHAQSDLLILQKRFGTTVVLVTHDMDEAFRLGTQIAVMSQGRLLQAGVPEAIIRAPADDFVAALTGGSGSALQLLSLSRVGDIMQPGCLSATARLAPLRMDSNLRDALSAMLWLEVDELPVADATGVIAGHVTRASIERKAAQKGSAS